MVLRQMAAEMARATSGVWKGIADTMDPAGSRPKAPEPAPVVEAEPEPDPEPQPEAVEPENTMLVPIDAWTRIMEQLGNLHEAGQQLAEARERAAKAETENEFLRAQVRELKEARPASARRKPAAPAEPATPSPAAAPAASAPAARETRAKRARRRVSGWLAP